MGEVMYYGDQAARPEDLARAAEILPRLERHFWVLEGGYVSDWAFGPTKPPPVPNPTMPWRRPTLTDLVRRLVEFRERPEYVLKNQSKHNWRGPR